MAPICVGASRAASEPRRNVTRRTHGLRPHAPDATQKSRRRGRTYDLSATSLVLAAWIAAASSSSPSVVFARARAPAKPSSVAASSASAPTRRPASASSVVVVCLRPCSRKVDAIHRPRSSPSADASLGPCARGTVCPPYPLGTPRSLRAVARPYGSLAWRRPRGPRDE